VNVCVRVSVRGKEGGQRLHLEVCGFGSPNLQAAPKPLTPAAQPLPLPSASPPPVQTRIPLTLEVADQPLIHLPEHLCEHPARRLWPLHPWHQLPLHDAGRGPPALPVAPTRPPAAAERGADAAAAAAAGGGVQAAGRAEVGAAVCADAGGSQGGGGGGDQGGVHARRYGVKQRGLQPGGREGAAVAVKDSCVEGGGGARAGRGVRGSMHVHTRASGARTNMNRPGPLCGPQRTGIGEALRESLLHAYCIFLGWAGALNAAKSERKGLRR